jgi:glycosyltransferase involved in cell wall biosynthesis
VISFIIPAHNEQRLIGRTLAAIKRAARSLDEPFEIVVVVDSSNDATAAIALEHGVVVQFVSHRQIARTRNAGARVASGDKFIFVDADTVVSKAAVLGAVKAMRDGAAGGGCAFTFDGWIPLYGHALKIAAVPIYRLAGLASGCFLFCTRTAFEAVGGFDETLFGAEEAPMSRALRHVGRFVVLRSFVTTSGRKLRAYSGRELLGFLAKLALAGPKSIRRREGLDVWYGPRRDDPKPVGFAFGMQ